MATGRELARIDDPDGANAAQIVFSPDGTQLIVILPDQPHIRIWDLRAVRHRLAELGLDWSPPPAWGSAASPISDFERPPPPKYRVDRGQLDQWIKLAPIKRREQAVADAEELLKQRAGPGRGSRVAGGVLQQSRLGAGCRAGVRSRPARAVLPWHAGRSTWYLAPASSSRHSAWPSIAPVSTARPFRCSSDRSPITTVPQPPTTSSSWPFAMPRTVTPLGRGLSSTVPCPG